MLVVVILLAVCLMTYQSYALWVINLSGQENIVEAGCFEVTYEELSTSISLKNTYPMSDARGLTTSPYTFKIKNNCTIDSKFNVTLNTVTTNGITKDKIKYAIVESGVSATSGINLGSVTNINTDTTGLLVENLDESIIIRSGALKQNEEKTYNLYLWLDEAAGNEVMGKTFTASVNVISAATVIKGASEETKAYLISKATNNELIEDDTTEKNLRYVGANPNNYVTFNNELWRIVGLMNNVDDGTGEKHSRIKLVRAESIGDYSWFSSLTSVNEGRGINEWSQSEVMKLLNPGYEEESVGGSLYWNNQSGTCYNGENKVTAACDFTSLGLNEDAKMMIGDAIWHTGSNYPPSFDVNFNEFSASDFYELERSSNVRKYCTSGTLCNDNIPRTTSWVGKVGLIYPSDYGYATKGGVTTDHNTCLNTIMYEWGNAAISDCKTNDWLFKQNAATITPANGWGSGFQIYYLGSSGNVEDGYASSALAIFPSVYLSKQVRISSGVGSVDDPFLIRLEA